ncbi:MAG: hypothetical protein H8E48_12135 [Chloroflexi bacterium]|nr:hypothetical protein [Chloroflexota bacterium]
MLKSIGGGILGILILALMVGLMGVCQWGYGEARPYVPGPVRSLLGGENEFNADDYLRSVHRAFEKFYEDGEECKVKRDQVCQTLSIERLRDRIGDGVPASASWISDAHGRLYKAIDEMAMMNKLSEDESNLTTDLIERIFAAQAELEAAAEEWYEQSIR